VIPIGVTGRIINHPTIGEGPRHGWLVRVKDDRSGSTGGVYVEMWSESEDKAFDNWLQDVADLDEYFTESGWLVEWQSGSSG
jgi:hypothetical protein